MTCTTKLGDTWDIVSYRELGSCRWAEKIIDLNRKHIDTVIFSAGVELDLPNVSNERQSKLPPWRVEQ